MSRLGRALEELASKLENPDNKLFDIAGDNDELVNLVAGVVSKTADTLREAAVRADEIEPPVTTEGLEEMAAIAEEFDKTGDSLLQKQASVLDEILLSISAGDSFIKAKNAQESETDKLREKHREQSRQELYGKAKKEHDEQNKSADAIKAINERVKEYRPLEGPLSTRSCPDHPGAQMMRIADNVYQCDLDKHIYNYEAGYKTMSGSKVPGTGVSNQTQHLSYVSPEHLNFSTREEILNK